MNKNGEMLQLNSLGPNGGTVFILTDYESKTISLIEIRPIAFEGDKIVVLEVESYTKQGFLETTTASDSSVSSAS